MKFAAACLVVAQSECPTYFSNMMELVNRNMQVEETRNPRLKNVPLGMPSDLHILLNTVDTCIDDRRN